MFKKSPLTFLILLLLTSAIAFASPTKCAVCGMDMQAGSPTSFESKKADEKVHFCSFVCANSYHQDHPKYPLWAHDFGKANPNSANLPRVDANKAFYLVQSEELEKYLKDPMTPSVVAFAKRGDADSFLSKMTEVAKKNGTLKKSTDGEVVQTFEAVVKKY